MNKTIVVFANSVKHHEHCVAGKDILTKEWIRPVGDKNGCELKDEQVRYNNPYGSYLAKPLQKMKIEFTAHAPLIHQPENYVVSDKNWIQNYNIRRDEIENYLDNPDNLWLDGISYNDRVNYSLIQSKRIIITQSLYLIKVYDIQIDKQNRRATFTYNGVKYKLAITDPDIRFVEIGQEFYYLVISLGENYQGNCYKLVAAIL